MTTHRNNKFSQLSPEDRATLLRWCENNPYTVVAEMCAQPRPMGLGFKTSAAALCRFYQRHNEVMRASEIAAQLARGIHSKHAREDNVFFAAILATIEQAIFTAMTRDQISVERLLPAMRAMMQMRRLRLAEHNKKHDFETPNYFVFEEREDSEPDFNELAIAQTEQVEPAQTPSARTEPTAEGHLAPEPKPQTATGAQPTVQTQNSNITPLPGYAPQRNSASPEEIDQDKRQRDRERRAINRGLSTLLTMAHDGLIPGIQQANLQNSTAIPA